jgi:hypothetical protein
MAATSLDIFPNSRGQPQEWCFSGSFASPLASINAPRQQEPRRSRLELDGEPILACKRHRSKLVINRSAIGIGHAHHRRTTLAGSDCIK